MASLIGSFKRCCSRFWDYVSEEAKDNPVQEPPATIEPEPDLAQTPQASVAEIDRSILSDQPATPQAISPQQYLTDISPCDCPIVEQNLRLGVERLTLGPLKAGKRARRGRLDDDAQPARSVLADLTAEEDLKSFCSKNLRALLAARE